MALSADVETKYTTIIDSILAASDLETISESRIRKGIQASVDYDITPQKAAIKALILTRFDRFTAKNAAANGTGEAENGDNAQAQHSSANSRSSQSPPTTVSKKRPPEDDDDDFEDGVARSHTSPGPAKKKKTVTVDSDAAYAARLQAQENSRARATRGGGVKKSNPVKKKTPKKKTASKIRVEDDSDLEESASEVKERKVNRNGGFHKELLLSPSLSALLDNEVKLRSFKLTQCSSTRRLHQLSRPQTVKRIWAYIREHELQDPNDKRMIRCDDNLRAVFKSDKIHMFTMNKVLNQNLYPIDE